MEYMCLIYDDEHREESPEESEARMQRYYAFTEEVRAAGKFVGGAPLEASSTATTVRVRQGDLLTTDGPFAETKEVFLGFFILDCEDLDEALRYAAKIPAAETGSVEVRPVMELG